jgi:hypothetical protein
VNVRDRGLVTEKLKSKDIIKEHASYCDRDREVKHFPGITLAYVTPVGVNLPPDHSGRYREMNHSNRCSISPVGVVFSGITLAYVPLVGTLKSKHFPGIIVADVTPVSVVSPGMIKIRF